MIICHYLYYLYFAKKTMEILYSTGSEAVYSLGKFSLIDKKVFWIYNIYGIVLDIIKMQKRNKEKVFELKVIGRV